MLSRTPPLWDVDGSCDRLESTCPAEFRCLRDSVGLLLLSSSLNVHNALRSLWPFFCVQSEIWDGSQMVHHVLENNISSLGNHCFPFLSSRWSPSFFSFSMQKIVFLGFSNCLHWPLSARAWQCQPMNRSRIPIHRLQSPRQPITSVAWATGNK